MGCGRRRKEEETSRCLVSVRGRGHGAACPTASPSQDPRSHRWPPTTRTEQAHIPPWCPSPPCFNRPGPSPQRASQPRVPRAAVVVGGNTARLKRQTRPGFIVGRRMLCVRVVAAGHMTAAACDPRHRPEVVSPAGPLGYARAGPGQADRPEAPGRTISGLFQLPEVPCPWLKAPCPSSQPAVQPGPSLTQSLPPPSHEDSVRTLGPREPRSVPSHGL